MANFLRAPCEDVAISPKQPVPLPKHCEKWVLVATILGSSMAFIDGTIVNVALPALQNALHASVSQIQWIIEAYALMLGTLLLVGGALGEIPCVGWLLTLGIGLVAIGAVVMTRFGMQSMQFAASTYTPPSTPEQLPPAS